MSSDAAFDQDASADGYVQRAELLADLRRFAEAARAAGEVLALGPDDAYAQRSAAIDGVGMGQLGRRAQVQA